MKLKVLAVDDHPDIRRLIKKSLESDFDVFLASGGLEAIEICESQKFDIILIDLMMPDMSGYELCSHFSEHPHTSDAYIVILSSRNDLQAKLTGYGLSAVNYLEKPIDPRLLRASLLSLAKRSLGEHEKPIHIGELSLRPLGHQVIFQGNEIKLTSSEFRLLCFLAQREGRVVNREQLLDMLNSSDPDVSDRVIDSHISSLRRKIKKSKVTIKAIYGEGYFLKAS